MPKLPEAVIAERDALMFEARKQGMSYRQIARAFDVSESTAHAGVQRVLERVHKRLAKDYSTYATLQLQRLDQLLQSIAPQTRKRKITTKDGGEIEVPPDLDAVRTALQIMDRQNKITGVEQMSLDVNVNMSGSGPSLAPAAQTTEKNPKQEAQELLKIMVDAGVFDQSMADSINKIMGNEEIIEADVVYDSTDVPELGSGDVDEDEIPEYYED